MQGYSGAVSIVRSIIVKFISPNAVQSMPLERLWEESADCPADLEGDRRLKTKPLIGPEVPCERELRSTVQLSGEKSVSSTGEKYLRTAM